MNLGSLVSVWTDPALGHLEKVVGFESIRLGVRTGVTFLDIGLRGIVVEVRRYSHGAREEMTRVFLTDGRMLWIEPDMLQEIQ